jgi:hypothetical protein
LLIIAKQFLKNYLIIYYIILMNYAEGDNNSQNGDNESTGDFCLMNHKRDRDEKNEIFYKEERNLEILDKSETENKSQNNFCQSNFQLIQERRHSLSNSINSNLSHKNKIRKKSENEVFIKERESALTAAKKNNPDIYFKEKLEEIGEKIINSQVLNQAIRGRPRDINIEHFGDWGLGIGDWGLGIGPNPQSPIPN